MNRWSESTLRAGFYVVIASIALAGLWLNIEPSVCPIPKALLQSDGASQPPCFEFYFNRYQTFIGSVAALAAAATAWIGVQKQMRIAAAQTRAAQRQVAVSTIEPLIARSQNIRRIDRLIMQAMFNANSAIKTSALVCKNIDDALMRSPDGFDKNTMLKILAEKDRAEQALKFADDSSKNIEDVAAISSAHPIESDLHEEIDNNIDIIWKFLNSVREEYYIVTAIMNAAKTGMVEDQKEFGSKQLGVIYIKNNIDAQLY